MSKTNVEFNGMRVTLTDGTKDRIAKVMKTKYKTKGGVTLDAADVSQKGRGLIVAGAKKTSSKKVDAKPSSKKVDAKPSSKKVDAGLSPAKAARAERRAIVTDLLEKGIFKFRYESKGRETEDLRELLSGAGKKPSSKKPSSKKTGSKKVKEEEAPEKKVTRRRGKKA